jgi:hypothetical protein
VAETAAATDGAGLPRFIERELRDFLGCGVEGHLRLSAGIRGVPSGRGGTPLRIVPAHRRPCITG